MQKRHDEKWNERFKELFDYRWGHGDCDVPVSQGKLDHLLGLWISTQIYGHNAAFKQMQKRHDEGMEPAIQGAA